jgi:hypothetical protein
MFSCHENVCSPAENKEKVWRFSGVNGHENICKCEDDDRTDW